MKDDTFEFNKLMSFEFFNFSERSCDPFLIQTSMLTKRNIAAGGGLRTLQQRKAVENTPGKTQKMVLPLDNSHVQKAKACQEMIMYEKTDAKSTQEKI